MRKKALRKDEAVIHGQVRRKKQYDVVSNIIAYENGELSDDDSLKLFAHLIKTGQAWTLQGHYGRTASALIEQGYISKEGKILRK